MIILISLFLTTFIHKTNCISKDVLPFNKYELISNYISLERKSDDFEYKNFDSVFELTKLSRTFRLCLKEINKPLSENTPSFSYISSQIKLYVGVLCDLKESKVSGTIVNNIFHGSITINNETFYIESIKKYVSLTKKCQKCHSVIYSENDMRINNHNIVSFPLSDDFIDRPDSHDTLFSKNQYKIDFERIYCDLTILIHESYISSYGSYLLCLATIIRHISKLNEVLFIQVNINGNALLQYQIFKIDKIIENNSISDNVEKSLDPIEILSNFSKTYKTCSTGMFVHSNWEGGRIGLARIGNSAGYGICNKQAIFMVNSKAENSVVPENIHMKTTIHEIGHNLGSIHDPYPFCRSVCYDMNYVIECSPGKGKNFVMQQSADNGNHLNNYKFSPCSLHDIINLATVPSRRTCLKKKSQSICGNGIIEAGEQCDSGDSKDICCGSPLSSMPCMVIFGECSPSQGSCCNSRCEFRKNKESCRGESVCSNIQTCNGTFAPCPTTSSKNEGKVCSSDFSVCLKGECNGLFCESFDKISCKCQYPNDCKLCCQDNFESTCKVLYDAMNSTYNVPKGNNCLDAFGKCDGNGRCIKNKIRVKGWIIRIFIWIVYLLMLFFLLKIEADLLFIYVICRIIRDLPFFN